MSEYLTLQSRYYALLKMCYFKAYSNVIEGFSVSGASLDKIRSIGGAPGTCPLLRTGKNSESPEQRVVVLVGIFSLNQLFYHDTQKKPRC